MTTQRQSRLAVLRGGVSPEFERSIQNGREMLDVLTGTTAHQLVDVFITRQGEWLVDGMVRSPEQVLHQIDGVMIALHGEYGEDGTVQRLIERHGRRYLGSRPYASTIGLHKMLTKEHARSVPVKQPRHLQVTAAGVTDVFALAATIGHLFGPEYMLKPMRGGGGIGNCPVRRDGSLAVALAAMLKAYPDILVEEYIEGQDVTCGVIEGFRGQAYYATPLIEILSTPEASDIYVAEKRAPGQFAKDVKEAVMNASVAAHRALGLHSFSRADFRVAPTGEVYFLEINTLPAVSKQAPLYAGLAAVGATQEELICHLADGVLN